jgi:cobaltochelatase CobS
MADERVGEAEVCAMLVLQAIKHRVASNTSGPLGRVEVPKLVDRITRTFTVPREEAALVVEAGIGHLLTLMGVEVDYDDQEHRFLDDVQAMMMPTGAPAKGRLGELVKAKVPVKTAGELQGVIEHLRARRPSGAPEAPRPTMADILAPRQEHRPLQRSMIDRNVIAGLNLLVDRATNGQIKTGEELINRLCDAEDQVRVLSENVVEGPQNAAAAAGLEDRVTYRWRSHSATLGDVVEQSMVGYDPSSGLTLSALMAMPVRVWTSTPPHPNVPKKDPHRRFDMEALKVCVYAIEHGQNAALVGPTGAGKTSFVEEIAGRLGRPFFRLPVDGEIGRRELIGGFKQVATDKGSETRWVDGLIAQAIRHPAVAVLDEFDRADPNLMFAAHQMLEKKDLQILEDGGRAVRMHPDCAFLATANTKGRADANGIYAMSSEMSEASRDRILFWVDYGYMSQDEEASLLMSRTSGLKQDEAKVIARIAAEIRRAFLSGTIRTACSPRSTQGAAAYYMACQGFDPGKGGLKRALEATVKRRAVDEDDERAIGEFIRLVLG